MRRAHTPVTNTPVAPATSALVTVLYFLALSIGSFAPCLGAQEEKEKAEAIPDSRITLKIEEVLGSDDGVSAHLVDVSTVKGTVTLSGAVGNAFARERARVLAETVKGVRSVVNRIEVRAVSRADDEIRQDVVHALLFDPAADSYEVTTTVNGGIVTLSGKVDSWHERRLAAEIALRVKGVRAVRNEIEVAVFKADRPDAEIKADVQSRLDWDPWVYDGAINIAVDDGKVTLDGAVGSAAEKSRARLLAHVLGVKEVDHLGLEVKWWMRDAMRREKKYAARTDDQIKEAVQDSFLQDPRVSAFAIDVAVENGTVTLSGKVDNLRARQAAQSDAENTLGVKRVKNRLRVRPLTITSDAALRREVIRALERDPCLDRAKITVQVRNAKVYLAGIVDSAFVRNHAELVASTLNGVVDVSNGIFANSERPYYGAGHESRPEPYRFLLPRLAWPAVRDQEVEDSIREEFRSSPWVDSQRVSVNVERGVATISGTVESWQMLRRVIRNAYEGGAISVRNELEVKAFDGADS